MLWSQSLVEENSKHARFLPPLITSLFHTSRRVVTAVQLGELGSAGKGWNGSLFPYSAISFVVCNSLMEDLLTLIIYQEVAPLA